MMNCSFLVRDQCGGDWKSGEEFPPQLAMLATLESSLAASQKALVALDLDRIRSATVEQMVLVQNIAAVFSFDQATPAILQQPGRKHQRTSIPYHPEPAEKLNQTAKRILDAARIQLALLSRLQRKLRVLSHALNGPSISYAPQARSAHRFFPAGETGL
jgi:hypothetical protein